jgi:2-polyprenyl-3-methyl-5-hydroxy-6-metoxy-1,4-benzoquinol methylase
MSKKRTRITPQSVIWAYRLFLDREPENRAVVQDKVRRLTNTQELRREFMNSAEFKERNEGFPPPAFSGNEPRMPIEEVQSGHDLQALLSHIHKVWEYLGKTEPHWSVLAAEQFKRSNIQKSEDIFYDSGRNDVATLFNTLDRNAIDYTTFKTCLEYGCGLGRVTRWLAERFEKVFAYDISRPHLQGAKNYLTKVGIRNVVFHHISKIQDIENLPKADLVYSVIVLQHNPPPVIGLIIKNLVKALNPGGVAFFQVPTYMIGYRFSLQEYLANEATKHEMEMHVLPQSKIFDIVMKEGGKPVEVFEDNWTGLRCVRSNTFLIQKGMVQNHRKLD